MVQKNKQLEIMKLNDDFSNLEEFEIELKNKGIFNLWERFQEEGSEGFNYSELNEWQEIFAPFGITFDYSLDAEPFDFKIN